MTDRTCIGSVQRGDSEPFNSSLSSDDVLSCCQFCGFGCNGGYPAAAFLYWTNPLHLPNLGVVTGTYRLQSG